jgi:hypothetical protein
MLFGILGEMLMQTPSWHSSRWRKRHPLQNPPPPSALVVPAEPNPRIPLWKLLLGSATITLALGGGMSAMFSGRPYPADGLFVLGFLLIAIALIVSPELKVNRKCAWLTLPALVAVLMYNHSLNRAWPFSDPNPEITVVVDGWTAQTGNAAGCTIYQFHTSGMPMQIDKLEMKMQFPMDVYTFKVGMMSEYLDSRGAMAAIGRSADGECYVYDASLVDDPAVRANKWGPGEVRIIGNDVPASSAMAGIFVLYMKQRSFSPTKLSVEGSYEYGLSGATKRGIMKIIDNGLKKVL